MITRSIKGIIEEIKEAYFDINEFNQFYLIEEEKKIRFWVKREGITVYDFTINIVKELRLIEFIDNVKIQKNEAKKYVLFYYLKKRLQEKGFTGFLTTNDGNKKYFKNLRIKLQPLDSYAEKIVMMLEKNVKEDERLFVNKKENCYDLINEKGEEKKIEIKFEDLGKENVIVIESNKTIYLNGEEWQREEMTEEEKKMIEKVVGSVIYNNEMRINERRIPIMKIKNNKKNKIIIGKEVLDKEELNEIIKKIKTMRIGFYL